MSDDNDLLNSGSYQSIRSRLFASGAEIFDRNPELFIRNPELVEVVNQRIREALSTVDLAARSQDAQSDQGLLDILGLGEQGVSGL